MNRIAGYFNISLKKMVIDSINSKYDDINVDEYKEDELLKIKEEIETNLEKYNISEDFDVLQNIETRLEQIDLELRTYTNHVFDSREEAANFKEDTELFASLLEGKEVDSDSKYEELCGFFKNTAFKSDTFPQMWPEILEKYREEQSGNLENKDKELFNKIVNLKCVTNSIIYNEVLEELENTTFDSQKYRANYKKMLDDRVIYINTSTVDERIKNNINEMGLDSSRLISSANKDELCNIVSDIKKYMKYKNDVPKVFLDISSKNDRTAGILFTEKNIYWYYYLSGSDRLYNSVLSWDECSKVEISGESIYFSKKEYSISEEFSKYISDRLDKVNEGLNNITALLKAIYESNPRLSKKYERLPAPMFETEEEYQKFFNEVEELRTNPATAEVGVKFISGASGEYYDFMVKEFNEHFKDTNSRVMLGYTNSNPSKNYYDYCYIFTEDHINTVDWTRKVWRRLHSPIDDFREFAFEGKFFTKFIIRRNNYKDLEEEISDVFVGKKWRTICEELTRIMNNAISNRQNIQDKDIKRRKDEERNWITTRIGPLNNKTIDELKTIKQYVIDSCSSEIAREVCNTIDDAIKNHSL